MLGLAGTGRLVTGARSLCAAGAAGVAVAVCVVAAS
jgi:hypothetical protein